jgi:hypothetical protein
MRQIWHIFKKDVRYLRLEVCLLFALALVYGWSEIRDLDRITNGKSAFPMLALELLTVFVIARVVHAEAIPGDRQYWITRPYRWRQLLTAKLLFIFVFVNGPLLMAQLLIVHAEKFPVLANWSALLWTQVLFFLCVSLPAAAIGAITSGLVSFVVSVLGFIAINGLLMPRGPLRDAVSMLQVEWVRTAAVLALVLASTVVILLMQYRYRRTLQIRIFAVVAAVLCMAVDWTLPFTFDLEAQTHTLPQSEGVSSIQIVMERTLKSSGILADLTPSNVQSESDL